MIEKIGHYSIENPASVYDEEAMTALELAGRTASKVNEAVQAFNELETETNKHLNTQDETIDRRMDEQDERISTMNDVTIPAKVTAEVQNRIEDGSFDHAIDKYAGGLESRLDNLLGSVSEGSTTGDAELIDARTDKDGITWANMGNHIRTLNALEGMVFDVNNYLLETVTPVITKGWYDTAGVYHAHEVYQCWEIPVNPGEVYVIHTYYGWDSPEALCFNHENQVVQVYHTSPDGGASNLYERPIVIPPGASMLAVNCDGSGGMATLDVKRIAGSIFTTSEIGKFVENVTAPSRANDNLILSGDIPGTILNGGFINRWGEDVVVTNEEAYKYYSGVFPVVPGEVYSFNASANWGNLVYIFMHDDVLMWDYSLKADVYTSVKGAIVAPMGATHVKLANENGVAPTVQKVHAYGQTDEAKMWDHLKWACLGDSLTEENIRTTKHYHTYIHNLTGIEVVNMGQSGTGYFNTKENNTAFYQRVKNMPADADVITIFGSGNDLGHVSTKLGTPTDTGTDTICGCVNTCLDNIYAINPTVQVGIVAPTPWSGGQTPNNDTCNMAVYTGALKEICRLRGIPFLDLFHVSGFRPDDATFRSMAFSKDPEGVANHPDETGHRMISGHFFKFLTGLIGTY